MRPLEPSGRLRVPSAVEFESPSPLCRILVDLKLSPPAAKKLEKNETAGTDARSRPVIFPVIDTRGIVGIVHDHRKLPMNFGLSET
jgi:hypothetical protein